MLVRPPQILERLTHLPRRQKQFIVLLGDVCAALAATWLAFSLRLEVRHFPTDYQWAAYGLSAVLFLPFFVRFGLYRAILRYSGVSMLGSAALSVLLYGVLFFAILLIAAFPGVPRSIGILQPILFFCLVFVSRITASQLLKRPGTAPSKNVLVYGAGDAGMQASQALAMTPEYRICGFLDDDTSKHGRRLNGVEVYSPQQISAVVERFGVTDVLIALPSASVERRRKIIDSLINLRLRVRTIPGILELASGSARIADFQELKIIDLLDRPPIYDAFDPESLRNKRVLVTGAGGSIGSELSRQIFACQPEALILFEHSEFGLYTIHEELKALAAAKGVDVRIEAHLGSIRDMRRLSSVFTACRPHIIYHSAAYKHVPLIEANTIEAITNNVLGTLNTARAAQAAGAERFMLISTDKAVRPTNIMGASKRLAELIVQAFAMQAGNATVFSMVRFGNVLGSSGSVVPLFRRQIAAGGPVTITDPAVTRYFMTIPEAVGLVLQASIMARGGEVFVLDMGEPVKIIDLARKMIRLSGKFEKSPENPSGDVEIVSIGLRPGEKLYEELLIGNNPQPTDNPHIMMAHESCLDWPELEGELAELRAAVEAEDVGRVIDVFRRTVVGFDNGGSHA